MRECGKRRRVGTVEKSPSQLTWPVLKGMAPGLHALGLDGDGGDDGSDGVGGGDADSGDGVGGDYVGGDGD